MVGGFGQLPRVGVARDVSTQVSLALLLTSTSQPKQCPSSRICFYLSERSLCWAYIDRCICTKLGTETFISRHPLPCY